VRGVRIVPDQLPDNEAFRYAESPTIAEVRFNVDHLLWKRIGDNEELLATQALIIYEFQQALRARGVQAPLPGFEAVSDPIGLAFGRKLAGAAILSAEAHRAS